MDEYEDPLDLLDDDGDGVIEMCLLEEEKTKKGNGRQNTGCCIAFLPVVMSLITSWFIL